MAKSPPIILSVPTASKFSFRAELYRCPYNAAEIHQEASRWADGVLALCDATEISPRARNRFADAYEAGLLAAMTAQHPLPPVWHGWVPSPLLASRTLRELTAKFLINDQPGVPIYHEENLVGVARGVEFYPAVSNSFSVRTEELITFEVDSATDLREAVLEFHENRGIVVKVLRR